MERNMNSRLSRRVSPRTTRLAAALLTIALALGVSAFPGESLAEGNAAAAAWQQIRNDEGILVSRKEVPGSSLIAFKGEGLIDAPVLLVGSVLVDTSRSKEWIDSLVESKIVRKVSDAEYVTYSHIATPIVMKDRDFVTDTRLEIDPVKRTVTIHIHSVNDPAAPSTSYVRGEIMNSSFVLTSTPDGKQTRIVTEIHCDPKGSVADWIVNLFQKGWPYNTIKSLRAQVKKPDISVHPQLKSAMDERGFFQAQQPPQPQQ
jgi:hypothetical protein